MGKRGWTKRRPKIRGKKPVKGLGFVCDLCDEPIEGLPASIDRVRMCQRCFERMRKNKQGLKRGPKKKTEEEGV